MIIKKNSFVGSFSSRHSLSQKNHRSEVCIRFPVQPAQAPTELCLGLDAWHQECVLFTKLCYGGNEYKLTLTSWNSLNFISIPVLFVKKIVFSLPDMNHILPFFIPMAVGFCHISSLWYCFKTPAQKNWYCFPIICLYFINRKGLETNTVALMIL